jgi:hypothetical protein
MDLIDVAQNMLVQWNQDVNQIMASSPWVLVIVGACVLALILQWPVRWLRFWLYYSWFRFTHWRRRTVGNKFVNYDARAFLCNGFVDVVNQCWLLGKFGKGREASKKRQRVFEQLAMAMDEPDFLPERPAKRLSQDAANYKKKLAREQLAEGIVGPVAPLPGDKPVADPKTATVLSMRKKGVKIAV